MIGFERAEVLTTVPFWRLRWRSWDSRAEIRRSMSDFVALRDWSSWRIREASSWPLGSIFGFGFSVESWSGSVREFYVKKNRKNPNLRERVLEGFESFDSFVR